MKYCLSSGLRWQCLRDLVFIASTLCLFSASAAEAQFPNPATNVEASDGTSTVGVQINWTAPAGGTTPTGYYVYRSTSNVFCGGSIVGTVPHPTTTFIDSTAVPNVIYYYSVRATASGSDGNCSNTDSGFRATPPPPLPPIGLTATNNQLDKIALNWQLPNQGEAITGIEIYRATIQILCSGAPLATLNTAATSYDDLSASPGQVYYFSLKSTGPTGVSSCSDVPVQGYRLEPPPPLPPVSVAATDGTFTNKVGVTWQSPIGSTVITNYRLHRSTSPSGLCNNLFQDGVSAIATSLDDTGVVPGRFYYYSMDSFGPNGLSTCSNLDPGHARISPPVNVSATDGTFEDKVVLTWLAPPLGGDITGYEIYKSTLPGAACAGSPVVANQSANVLTYTDTAITPGQLYYYSLKTLAATGPSECSDINSGYARIGAPNTVSATDGTFTDRVDVTWTPPSLGGLIVGYTLYRDLTPLSCQTVRVSGIGAGTLSFSDTLVLPGTTYYYSVRTVSATGESVCSSVDPGFAKPLPVCSDGIDNDNDGKIDAANDPGCLGDPNKDSEKDITAPICDNGIDDDGDGKIDFRLDAASDPGCTGPGDNSEDDGDTALKSPAYIKFNTFLGQWNYAELINQGTSAKQVGVTVYNLFGQPMISRTYSVPAKSEIDVDVNGLVMFACDVLKTGCADFVDLSKTQGAQNGLGRPDGVVDTYGLVRIDFDDSNADQRLLGRMSFYRPDPDGKSYSFAFAREFRNSLSGKTYSIANVFDPQGAGNLVPNWAEVINLSDIGQSYTINIFTQDGALKKSTRLALAPLGEFDVQAGHEFRDENGKVQEAVYLVEVIPDSPNAPYSFSVSRYSSTASSEQSFDPASYNFAFSVDGLPGSTERLFAPIANFMEQVSGVDAKVSVSNWVEVVNVSPLAATFQITFKNKDGSVRSSVPYQLAPKSQFHFNASAILAGNSSGSVDIKSNQPVIVQSLSYAHGSDNRLQAGFVSLGRTSARKNQAGSINTFLEMQNILTLVSTTSSPVDADFAISSFSGGTFSGVIGIGGSSLSALQLSNNAFLSFPANAYGAMLLSTPQEGQVIGEVRRIRVLNGAVDFVMPTSVR